MSALVHGIRILRLFSAQTPSLGISEISRALGLSRSNTHRILSILVEERMLEKTSAGTFRLSLSVLELAAASAEPFERLQDAARPAMDRLVRETGETVHLAVLDRGQVVYIDKVESPHSLRIITRLGGRLPAHCTAAGKVMLAYQPHGAVQKVIDGGMERFTANTITGPQQLLEHLEQIRQCGYATGDEEIEPGVRVVAAPIRDRWGQVVAAVNVAGPAIRMSRQKMAAAAAALMEAAREISAGLGHEPGAPDARPVSGGPGW